MRIECREETPLVRWLPKKSPLRGLLEGDEFLAKRGRFNFSARISTLPPPRVMDPSTAALLREQHLRAGAPEASLRQIDRLAKGARAVVTGQQAGLLGGPFLTFLKAATAIAVAAELTERSGEPFVPVFWAEGGDHDFTEFDHAVILDPEGTPKEFTLPWPEERRRHSAGTLSAGADAAELAGRLFDSLGRTDFSDGLRRGALEDLEGGGTLSGWFRRWMLRHFGRHGLVVFDSLERGGSDAEKSLWVRILEEPLLMTEELRRAGEELAAAGYRPVLAKEKRRCPFFLLSGGRREAVYFERGSFRSADRRHTPLEMRRRLDEHPADFSPGVNLRPLVQDTLLPTAVTVAGPTELSYFLQVLPGYAPVGLEAPAIVLRAGMTIVEPAVLRVLKRLKLEPSSLRSGTESVIGSILRRENRLADPARWEKARLAAARPLERLAERVGPGEREIAELLNKSGGQVDFLLRETEKKAVALLRRRSDLLREQLRRAGERLYPRGQLQERILSPCYFLNKYGDRFVDALVEALPRTFTAHCFGSILP